MNLTSQQYMTKIFLPHDVATKVWKLVDGEDITSLNTGIRRAIDIALDECSRNNSYGTQLGE